MNVRRISDVPVSQFSLCLTLLDTFKKKIIHIGTPPPPSCESNARVRATASVVSAIFGIVLYLALYIDPPLVRATVGVVSVKLWDFSVALARWGGTCGSSYSALRH